MARKLGAIGALAVFVGVFCPYLEVEGVFSLSFWSRVCSQAWCSSLSRATALWANFGSACMLRNAGGVSLVIVVVLFLHRVYELSTWRWGGLQLGFGWYVLIAGSVLMLLSSLLLAVQARHRRGASPLDAYDFSRLNWR